MKKKLSIELQEELIRFIVSGHKKSKIELLEVLETGYELDTDGEESEADDEDQDAGPESEEESGDLLDRGIAKIQEVIKVNKWERLKKTLLYNLGDLNHMVLELPLVTEDEMEDAVRRKLMGEKLLKDGEEIAYETIGAKDSKGLYGVYVQVIPKELLDKLQPLKLQGIDFEVFAMNRKQVSYTNPKENTMFLDIGRKQATINIYYHERLALSRKVNTGEDDIVEEIGKILEIEAEEANKLHEKYGFVDTLRGSRLLDEGEMRGMDLAEAYENVLGKMERKIYQYIDYFQFRHSGENLKTMYYKGGALDIELIGDHLKKTFYLENVFRYNHLQGIITEKLGEDLGTEWATLLGTVESKHGAKFIGKAFKLPFKAKKNPIYIAIAVVFISFMGIRYGYYKVQEMDQIKRLEAISVRQKEIEKDLEEYNAVQKKIGELKRDIAYLSGITGKNTIFNNFLSDLSYSIDAQIFMEDISYSDDKVTLKGKAVSGTEYAEVYINEMLRQLEKITKEVKLIRTTKLAANRNVNEFLIEVTLSGGDMNGQ